MLRKCTAPSARFARIAQEAAVKNEMRPVFDAYARILRQCVACLAAYRTR